MNEFSVSWDEDLENLCNLLGYCFVEDEGFCKDDGE